MDVDGIFSKPEASKGMVANRHGQTTKNKQVRHVLEPQMRGSGEVDFWWFLFVFSVIEVSSLNELGKEMCVCHVFFSVCHIFMLQLKKVASLASSKKEVVWKTDGGFAFEIETRFKWLSLKFVGPSGDANN